MTSLFSYLILVLVGILPSIIWLAYWLRKDCHPEPKALIAKTLLLGIILSPLAIVAQLVGLQWAASITHVSAATLNSSSWFYLWAAFVEELIKYGAVFFVVLRNPEFDEPVDAMIYMLTAALGFAAMENILVANHMLGEGAQMTLRVLGLRFTGATLLHALSSALLGYFIALGWFAMRARVTLFISGLLVATVFHWTFNLFVAKMNESLSIKFSTALLIAMAFLISILFDKIKERDIVAQPTSC
jgi:RsiW-degrading membrane proteinase PrsW (M82 family)